jgi:23S rRNA C2498 (ribose-2'-O)-methylase RlmM
MYQDFGGGCGFHLQCSPGRFILVISQKTVVFFRQVFFLGKTVKMLLCKNRIADLMDALKLSKEQKMDIRYKYESFSFSSITVNGYVQKHSHNVSMTPNRTI